MKKLVRSLFAVLTLTILISSCSTNNGTTNPQTGFFLIASVSPDAKPITVAVNGTQVTSNQPYGAYTRYISATAGAYNFAVYDSGATSPAITNTVDIAVSKAVSYFLIDSAHKLQAVLTNDAFLIPSGDSSYVRFFNFTPNLPEPINVVDSAANAGTGAVLFSSRAFNDQATNPSYVNFNELKSGTYTLQIKLVDGTLVTSQSVTLTGGKVYTLFAKGFYGGTGAQALGIGVIENYPQQ